jgi:hypothetical protein
MMDQSYLPDQTSGSWRYFAGIGFMVCAAALALLGYLAFPHGNPMNDSWERAMGHTSMLLLGAFGCLIVGGLFISLEMMRRHDRRVKASCPIDRKAYREALLRMMRQADRHPKMPVDPKEIRHLLELLEPANVSTSAAYTLTTKEE